VDLTPPLLFGIASPIERRRRQPRFHAEDDKHPQPHPGSNWLRRKYDRADRPHVQFSNNVARIAEVHPSHASNVRYCRRPTLGLNQGVKRFCLFEFWRRKVLVGPFKIGSKQLAGLVVPSLVVPQACEA
jgi:hypothetical protein